MKKENYYLQNSSYKIVIIGRRKYYEIVHNKQLLDQYLQKNICIGCKYNKKFNEISVNVNKYILREFFDGQSTEIEYTDYISLRNALNKSIKIISKISIKNKIKGFLQWKKYIQITITAYLVLSIFNIIKITTKLETIIFLSLCFIFLILDLIESYFTKKVNLRSLTLRYDNNPLGYFFIIAIYILIIGVIIIGFIKSFPL